MIRRIPKSRNLRVGVEPCESRRLLSFAIASISQDGDFVGPDASVGPDGVADIHLALGGLIPGVAVESVDVSGDLSGLGTVSWRFGDNPRGLPDAELVRVTTTSNPYFPYLLNDASPTADLYISPPPAGTTLAGLTVTLHYRDPANHPDETRETAAIPPIDPGLASASGAVPDGLLIPEEGGRAHFVGQFASAGTSPTHDAGDVHVSLDAAPGSHGFGQIVGAYLSDGIAGLSGPGDLPTQTRGSSTWSWVASSPTIEAYHIPLKFQVAGDHVDLAFPPVRDETGTTMTLRLVVEDSPGGARHSFYTQFAGGFADVNLRDADNYDHAAPFLDVRPALDATGDPIHNLVTYQDPGNAGAWMTRTLQDLLSDRSAGRFDRIHLVGPATYYIDHPGDGSTTPLVIDRPVQLDGDPGAVLMFTADSSLPAGSTGEPVGFASPIFIHSSHVTLSNFQIRFQNPATLGGAVIAGDGWNQLGASRDGVIQSVDLTLDHLDIQGPRLVIGGGADLDQVGWDGETAPDLININRATGVINDCTLRGGGTVFNGGPWRVTGNNFVGLVPTAASYPDDYANASRRGHPIPTHVAAVFSSSAPHDQWIADNHASLSPLDGDPVEAIGEAYRFLLYSGGGPAGSSGYHLIVRDNVIGGGVGRRADSEETAAVGGETTGAYPGHNLANDSEIFLTEDYLVNYEGITLPLGADRRILSLPSPGSTFYRAPVIAGDVVSILTGPDAGRWYRVAQVLDASDFLMDQPLPAGDYRVSVGRGLVDLQFDHNTVDLRGTTSTAFFLVGNLFDTGVTNNHIIGDDTTVADGVPNLATNVAIHLESSYQNTFGANDGYEFPHPIPNNPWTHDVVFGATIAGNQIEGVGGGVVVYVNHESGNSDMGRTYLSASVSDNRFFGYGPTPDAGAPGVADISSVLTIGATKQQLDKVQRFQVNRYLGYAVLDAGKRVIPNPDPSLGYAPAPDDPTHHYRFADPAEIRVTLGGNWCEPMAGSPVVKDLTVVSAVVNGTPVVFSDPGAVSALPAMPLGPMTFRFGEANSEAANGDRGASNLTGYSAGLGYGFTARTDDQNALTRPDGRGEVYASSETFRVDLPNGTYLVSPTLGQAGEASDLAVVTLQGIRVDLLASGRSVTAGPYVAVVTDGHLVLEIASKPYLDDPDHATHRHYVSISALTITPLPFLMPRQFDFGPGDQVVAPGFTPVSNYSEYDTARGYGWGSADPGQDPPHSNDMNAEDREATAGDALARDGVYASVMTFQVALPNGTYLVRPTLAGTGDVSDAVAVTLQGSGRGTVATAATAIPTYLAVVTDGYLRLKLQYAGDAPGHMAEIAGLTLIPLADGFPFAAPVVGDGRSKPRA